VVDDVVVDGLSLAASYRAQIHRVLRDGSYADVLARLRDHASPATLIAIARSKRSAPAAPGSAPLPPLVGAAAATAPLPPSTLPVPPPVRIASTAPASDAPLLGSRVVPAVATVAPAVAIGPPPARPATASIAAPGAPLHPPAVAPAPAPPAVVRSAPRWFWIQVGAFRGTDAASRLVERLRRHPVTVTTGTSGSGPLARVLVGPFASRAAAAPALRELAAAGYRAFIATE
jgi:cell division septation protein DedD